MSKFDGISPTVKNGPIGALVDDIVCPTTNLNYSDSQLCSKSGTGPEAKTDASSKTDSEVAQPTDEYWMRRALDLAAIAGIKGEIPIAALIVCDGKLISEAGNLKEANQDPVGHAEILAIRMASENLGRWRLSNCTLYVTLEPCTMCAGAIIQARVRRVVFAAKDPKAGAVCSLYQILNDPRLNHSPEVTGGVLEKPASQLLQSFFRDLRDQRAHREIPQSADLPK